MDADMHQMAEMGHRIFSDKVKVAWTGVRKEGWDLMFLKSDGDELGTHGFNAGLDNAFRNVASWFAMVGTSELQEAGLGRAHDPMFTFLHVSQFCNGDESA